ncbi:MAG: hypothetical protein ACLQL2_06225 [Methylovirgula sp.]
MILALSLASLFLGTGLAYTAPRMPAMTARLEQSGGALFVAGLVLIGTMLQQSC